MKDNNYISWDEYFMVYGRGRSEKIIIEINKKVRITE